MFVPTDNVPYSNHYSCNTKWFFFFKLDVNELAADEFVVIEIDLDGNNLAVNELNVAKLTADQLVADNLDAD